MSQSAPRSSTRWYARPWGWVVGALAVLAVLAGVVALSTSGNDDEPAAKKPEETTLRLQAAGAGAQSKCMVPTAGTLALADEAFEGTVTRATDEEAVLDVTRHYTDGSYTTASVRTAGAALTAALDGVTLEVGKSYLVSSAGGMVTLCGFSGPAEEPLRALYAEAFGK